MQDGFTALMNATELYIVQALLEVSADVNAKDNDGNTALSLAISREHAEIAKALRQVGATE